MANSNSPHSNQSQFFITLDACEWLNNKHTIFGKVTGNTIFNILRSSKSPFIHSSTHRSVLFIHATTYPYIYLSMHTHIHHADMTIMIIKKIMRMMILMIYLFSGLEMSRWTLPLIDQSIVSSSTLLKCCGTLSTTLL